MFSELEKMKFISDGIQNEKSLSEYCKSQGISTDFFNKWKNDNSQYALRKLNHNGSGYNDNEIIRFEHENIYLKVLIDELQKENDLLKKLVNERNKSGVN